MAKLLKPMVIVLLLLSIASLVLGVMLFNQREVIKGRTQRLEEATAAIAASIHFPDHDPEQLKDYDRMQLALNRLNVYAANQYQELQDTKQDLANTKLDLEQTRDELRITQDNLTAAKQEIVSLEGRLSQREAELARANQDIAQLRDDKIGLQAQINDLDIQLTAAQEEKRELQDELSVAEETIASLERLLDKDTMATPTTPVGLTGEIMVVNKDWNFVVLDVGSEQGLSVNSEMLVHRGDELVGRVRVSSVDRDLAVAEILSGWQQKPLQEGDHVLF